MRRDDVLRVQQGFARAAVAFIVASALALTYDGTMTFSQEHGALGWRGAVIAGMNDLAVLVGILWPERPLQALAALCAGFTIWANVDHAKVGAAGLAVALIPPLLAILMVAALEYVLKTEGGPEPVPVPKAIEEPVFIRTEVVPEPRRKAIRARSTDEAFEVWLRERPGDDVAKKAIQDAKGCSAEAARAQLNRWKARAARLDNDLSTCEDQS